MTEANSGLTAPIQTLEVMAITVVNNNIDADTPSRPRDFGMNTATIQIDACWYRTSKTETAYISVKLDDPSFSARFAPTQTSHRTMVSP